MTQDTIDKTTSLLFILLSIAWQFPAFAEDQKNQDEAMKTGSIRCISLAHIRSMDILDNKRILFNMDGKKQYLSTMPHQCSGLRKGATIMYRTSLHELCDLDIITVLDTIGGGFMPGSSCGLGRFELVDKLLVEKLKKSELKEGEKEEKY